MRNYQRLLVALPVFPLLLTSAASAGAVIDLVPTQPGPFAPGQRVVFDVQLTQQPGGQDRYFRLIQFDVTDTDSALVLDEAFRFDYSAQAVCASNPELCGAGYAEFPPPVQQGIVPVVATVYTGFVFDPAMQIRLPTEGSITVASIGVTLPTQPGEYLLDLINATQPSPNGGARFDFGFGPDFGFDPYTTWRAYNEEAIAGGVFTTQSTASANFMFDFSPTSGVITPEPATLVLLAIGGLIAASRRRRAFTHSAGSNRVGRDMHNTG